MESPKFVTRTLDERVGILTIHNPPANVLRLDLLDELAAELDRIADDPAVKVAVLASPLEKFFVAGADIKELANIGSGAEGTKFSEKGQALLDKIELSRKPFIAAAEGFCLGGGLELVLACHMRIAGTGASFGFPEINLGLIPGFGGTVRISRLVGQAKALELTLTGSAITAEQAWSIGLVNQVVKKGAALDTSLSLARQIQGKGARAVAAVLDTVLSEGSRTERLQRESRAFGELFGAEDAREGIKAFLEKRVPHFKDR
ncbi:MAG: enoyl-CoA hydratase/isomerase family protein [Nitrospinae bacterium]|nr:enoyl-CoA hydratase/isomerase family protein [Nitrospinota bacterium]